jgi:ribosomal protein S18 acetylase RimI-like enzyme
VPTQIREASPGDLVALADLLAEINNPHAEALPHVYQRIVPSGETTSYLRRILDAEDFHLYVADAAGSAVGMVIFQEAHAPDTPVHVPRRWVVVSLIVVGRACRGQGIGRDLMRHVQTWARLHDIDRIELQVAEFNTAAIAWYEALGFSTQYRRMTWSASADQDRETRSEHHD